MEGYYMKNVKGKLRDWTSKKWHRHHNWRAGTGKFLKKIMNRKIRHQTIKPEEMEE
tara:strand:+ start:306 stop:473 length:168 start_codon:yes stop_codon:yes gene_type:complete